MNVPSQMRVARLHRWGEIRIEQVRVPKPRAGEALVRVEACGVCGSDGLVWYVERKAPAVLGHEPAGVVAALGRGSHHVEIGDRVFVHHHAPCLTCPECRRGLWSNCATWQATRLEPGGFAEYLRVPAPNLKRDTLKLPDNVDFDVATFVEPLACCVRAIRRQGRLEAGDVALIVGLGAMGQLMVQLARAYGAGAVLGSDYVGERRERALHRGADAVFDPTIGEVGAGVRGATEGRGADVVLVCPGDPAAIAAGVAAAAPGGRVVCFTPLAPHHPLTLDDPDLYFREVTLTHSYSCGPSETREALQLLSDGVVEVRSLVTHREGLDGVSAALERAAGKSEGFKTIVYPGGAPVATGVEEALAPTVASPSGESAE